MVKTPIVALWLPDPGQLTGTQTKPKNNVTRSCRGRRSPLHQDFSQIRLPRTTAGSADLFATAKRSRRFQPALSTRSVCGAAAWKIVNISICTWVNFAQPPLSQRLTITLLITFINATLNWKALFLILGYGIISPLMNVFCLDSETCRC